MPTFIHDTFDDGICPDMGGYRKLPPSPAHADGEPLELMGEMAFDVCNCGCHRGVALMHCFPCCEPCPTCGWIICLDRVEEHAERCLGTQRQPTD